MKNKKELMEKLLNADNNSDENSELEKNAKVEAIKKLRGKMSKLIGEGIQGKMQKVVVASPDKEGLKEGLDKAKDIIEKKDELKDPVLPEECDYEEEASEEMMDPSEIEAKIAELKEMLEKAKASK